MARASRIVNRNVVPLWEDRIFEGTVHVIAGRPGGGKSLLGVRIACDVSKKGNVILSQSEEIASTMLGPRLDAVGANKKRIIYDLDPMFPEDIAYLREVIEKYKVKLMIIDPVNEHLSDGIKRQSDSIRKATKPAKRLAEDTGCAIVFVDHVIKNVAKNSHPMNAIGGASSGLAAAGRMIYIVGRDPEDKDRIIMCNVKTQLRDDPLPLEFLMDEEDVPGIDRPQPLLVKQGEIEDGYDPMLMLAKASKGGKLGRPPTKREQATEFLTDYLFAAPNHQMKATVVIEDAKQYGITKRTLETAKSELDIVSVKKGNEWWWTLPQDLIDTLNASS